MATTGSQITVPVTGLTCRRCTETVTEQLTQLPGVSDVAVDLVAGGTSVVTIHLTDAAGPGVHDPGSPTGTVDITDEALQSALSAGGAFHIVR